MAILSELQMFPIEELSRYDSDEAYMFVFLDKEQIEELTGDKLIVKGKYLSAVDDTAEWIRFNSKRIIDDESVFVAVCQRSMLLSAGFIEPKIVDKDPMDWTEKIDDGFEELRLNHDTILSPVGYCAITQKRTGGRDVEAMVWQSLNQMR